MTKTSPYILDILNQPQALQNALQTYPIGALNEARKLMIEGAFDRILITGMGASYMAAIPAVEILSQSRLPVLWIETAELLHYRMAQITPRTLLWAISQSGASVEIVRLIEAIKTAPPGHFLGITNNMASLLAQQCSVTLPLSAGDEFTVSTKTYVTSLAVAQLAALELLGQPLDGPLSEFSGAVELMQVYLDRLPEFDHELREEFSARYQRCVLLGRGRSMAAALNGSLVLKEAAKVIIEGMSVAHFRHGPLELVDSDLSVLLLAGDEQTAAINRGLARDVVRYGGKVFWIGYQPEETLPALTLPHVSDLVLPLFEILPIQLMTIAFGELNGVQPGMFRHIGKVTDTE